MASAPPTKPSLQNPETQSNPNTTISQTSLDIRLVSVPETTIASLGLQGHGRDDGGELGSDNENPNTVPRRRSWLGSKYKKYKDHQRGLDMRYVRMPVGDYERYWARDDKGRYSGTEPEGCEEGLRMLKMRIQDEEMQNYKKKTVRLPRCCV